MQRVKKEIVVTFFFGGRIPFTNATVLYTSSYMNASLERMRGDKISEGRRCSHKGEFF